MADIRKVSNRQSEIPDSQSLLDDPRGNEEQDFLSVAANDRATEYVPYKRERCQSRHPFLLGCFIVDQDSPDDGGSAVTDENAGCGFARTDGGDAVDLPGKVRGIVLHFKVQDDVSLISDLRRYG